MASQLIDQNYDMYYNMFMIDRDPFRTPSGRPVIAHIGEVVDKTDISFLQMAAGELNETHGTQQYLVVVPSAAGFGPKGNILPKSKSMIKIAGAWATKESSTLDELVDRAQEIKTDLSDLDSKY